MHPNGDGDIYCDGDGDGHTKKLLLKKQWCYYPHMLKGLVKCLRKNKNFFSLVI